MSDKVFVSIIVLNWNGKQWLRKCFDSIKNQTYKNFEVIMTDNGSSDDSIEFVKKKYPFVKILENGINLGYTGANNSAAKIAQGKYLIFLNNDTWLEPDFIQTLFSHSRNKQHPKIIQPLILPYNETDRTRCIVTTGLDRFSYPAVMSYPFYVDGCCFIIESALFRKLGGFDERYFIFMEDIDLSWRAQLIGEKIYRSLRSVVHHECGGTVVGSMEKSQERHKTSTRRRYLSERNSLSNVLKNYELKNVLWIAPIHVCLGVGEVLLYLFSGKFKAFLAILKAIGWNILNIGSTLEERQKIQSMRTVPDAEIFKRMIRGVGKWRAFRDVGGVPRFAS